MGGSIEKHLSTTKQPMVKCIRKKAKWFIACGDNTWEMGKYDDVHVNLFLLARISAVKIDLALSSSVVEADSPPIPFSVGLLAISHHYRKNFKRLT